ncbi:MAG TPA: hypothetical protein VFI41_11140 [Gemmatimonadales bacterium]|jgi:hypothetical protein|nr:hypothetical protein [Gemmatimonadales bacterium]
MFIGPKSARRARVLLLACLTAYFGAACGEGGSGPSEEATSIAIISAPFFVTVGHALSTQPVVELRDQNGRALAVAGIGITASVSKGTLNGTTNVQTDQRGRATFTDLVVDGIAGQSELRFSCCRQVSASSSLSLLGDGPILRLDPEVVTGFAGATLSPGPRVLLRDEGGLPRVAGTVRFEFDSATTLSPVSVVADTSGVATLPSFQFPDLPSSTRLRAVDVATGVSVTYSLVGTVRGRAYPDSMVAAVTAGDDLTLPRIGVYDDATNPVAGALVRYRIASGDGALSTTEAYTGIDGWTGPVTLSTSSRGTTVIEMVAVGYSGQPILDPVIAVVPPLSFEYAGPCEPGCPASFDFAKPLESGPAWTMDVLFHIGVRDAIGPVPGYEITLTKDPAASYFWVDDYDYEAATPEQKPIVTDSTGLAWLAWRLPQAVGSYHFTMGGPMIDTPWTYTATVE